MPRLLVQDMKASLAFDGADDYVAAGYAVTYSNPRTVSFWLKPRSFSTNQNIVSMGSSSVAYENASLVSGAVRVELPGTTAGMRYTSPVLSLGNWVHVTYVHGSLTAASRSAGDLLGLYINGQAVTPTTSATGGSAPGIAALALGVTGSAALTNDFNGLLADVRVYESALTAAEVSRLYASGVTAAAPAVRWLLGEGAGTAATDSSGNSVNGTISGATFSPDTPTKKRTQVGGNLVSNGDFEYAPPFTAATNTTNTWINGTAAGSTGDNLFGWSVYFILGTVAARYDTSEFHSGAASLKLSTSATGSQIVASRWLTASAANAKHIVPVEPNKSYTLTYWMKTSVTSGSSSTGAYVRLREWTGAAGLAVTNLGTPVVTTSGWTQYTVTVTTGATTRYLTVEPAIIGNDGAATLIMDAWFDDISLTETTPVGRSVAQDFKASLKTTEASTDKIVLGSNIALTGELTISIRSRLIYTTSTRTLFGHSSDNAKLALNGGSFFVRCVNSGSSDNAVAMPSDGNWHTITVTRDASNKVDLYIDGKTPTRLFSNAAQSGTWNIDQLFVSTGALAPGGSHVNAHVFARCMTGAEVALLHAASSYSATSLQLRLPFQEGAGSTANDTSGNGNAGTVTSATWSADVPTKARKVVGGSKVENGSFEYAPPFVAATTAAQWVDGTSGGSSGNPLFGWAVQIPAGSGAVRFDPSNAYSGANALKVSTTAVSSHALATPRQSPLGLGIVVAPNRTYTYSFWMKTTVNSGAGSDGAWIAWKERTPSGSNIATTNSTKVNTTTGWTQYTGTFTTSSTTYYMDPQLTVQGNTGAATLIMDAWFDDITLTETTPVIRTLVS